MECVLRYVILGFAFLVQCVEIRLTTQASSIVKIVFHHFLKILHNLAVFVINEYYDALHCWTRVAVISEAKMLCTRQEFGWVCIFSSVATIS